MIIQFEQREIGSDENFFLWFRFDSNDGASQVPEGTNNSCLTLKLKIDGAQFTRLPTRFTASYYEALK